MAAKKEKVITSDYSQMKEAIRGYLKSPSADVATLGVRVRRVLVATIICLWSMDDPMRHSLAALLEEFKAAKMLH